MSADRSIRVCPAAYEDFRLLLPRVDSRAAVVRHALKLRSWRYEDRCAVDVAVTAIPNVGILGAY